MGPFPSGPARTLREVLILDPENVLRLIDVESGHERAHFGDHPAPVWDASVSANGATVVSVDEKDNVILWNATDGREISRWGGLGAGVDALISNDGAVVVTLGDRTVLWSGVDGALIADLTSAGPAFSRRPVLVGDALVANVAGGTFVAWDVRTGSVVASPPDGSGEPLAFSADGALLALASRIDGSVRIWDTSTWSEIATIAGADGDAATFSPDGSIIAISNFGTVSLWRTDGWTAIALEQPTIRIPAFSADSRRYALIDQGGVSIRDSATGAEIAHLPSDGLLDSVAFAADGSTVATMAADDEVFTVWDLGASGGVGLIPAPPSAVDHDMWQQTVRSADGTRLLSMNTGVLDVPFRENATVAIWDQVELWDPTARRRIAVLGHGPGSLSPNGRRAATTGDRNEAVLWDGSSGREIARLIGHAGPVTAVAFSPDSALLATGSVDGTVRLWRAEDGVVVAALSAEGLAIATVGFSADGCCVFALLRDEASGRIWETATGDPVGMVEARTIAPVPGGSTALVSNWDSSLLYDLRTGAVLAGGIEGPIVSSTGERIVGWNDRVPTLWDAQSGIIVARFGDSDVWVGARSFSPDGSLIATGDETGSAKIWSAQDGALIADLGTIHGYQFAFSPDNAQLLIGPDRPDRLDGYPLAAGLVVNPATGVVLAELKGADTWLGNAAFSGDGTRLATILGDDAVGVWNTRDGMLLARAHISDSSPALGGSPEWAASDDTVILRFVERLLVWNVSATVGADGPSISCRRLGLNADLDQLAGRHGLQGLAPICGVYPPRSVHIQPSG